MNVESDAPRALSARRDRSVGAEAENITESRGPRGRIHYRRGRRSSAHVADVVRDSPARAEPHDALAWLPVPAPDSLPAVDELLGPDASQGAPDSAARESAAGLPGPGRAEPHDVAAWLPLPDLSDLPSIDELLSPGDRVPAPAAREVTAVPSPARAEPHDARAWLPLPDVGDLPEVADLVAPSGRGSGRRGAPPTNGSRPRTTATRHPIRRFVTLALVAVTLGALYYGSQIVLDGGADIEVRVDGRLLQVETGVSTIADVLGEQRISLGDYDRVVPKPAAAVRDGMKVRVLRAFAVSVDFDGTVGTVYSTHSVPKEFLADATEQLGSTEDVAIRGAPKFVEANALLMLRTQKVGTLLVDGSAVNYDSPSLTVRELLDAQKVIVGPDDFTSPVAIDEVLPTNESITVTRVAAETTQADESYVLEDQIIPDPELPLGESRAVAGTAGVQRVTYNITRHDGAEIERTVISAVPLIEATPNVTYFGTKADPRWDKIAQCETGGNWRAQGPTYQGGLGIYFQTWKSFGGRDFANNAGDATREEQIIVAERIRAKHGFRAWGCGKTLGY